MSAHLRIAILAQQKQTLFHSRDLKQLWDVKNDNTLYTLLKRYTQQGLLYRIHKGFYSLLPLNRIDPILLGIRAIHGYAYISTETILTREGIIPQIVRDITIVSSFSRKFHIGAHRYLSRQLQDKYLYSPAGIEEREGILMATVERAVADLLYFNPRATLDGIALIDFAKVQSIQKEIGYLPSH